MAAIESPVTGPAESDVISLTIPAAMRFVRLVRIGASSIARRKGLPVRAIDSLRLAVDESFGLLLNEADHDGSIEVTFEVDDHELVVLAQQRITNGPIPVAEEDLIRFNVLMTDLVARFDADPSTGVVQFSFPF